MSYDLVRDAEEYAREQSGVPKAPESVGWMVRYLRSLARPMGRIHVDFGEPVHLALAPDPNDQLAISKIAFQVAVEANRVMPATFPAVVSTALLGAFPRALTEHEIIRKSLMTQWATSRGVRLSPDFNLEYASNMANLLENMIKEGIITRFDGGPETAYGIADGQARLQASTAIRLSFFRRERLLNSPSRRDRNHHPALPPCSGQKCRSCVTCLSSNFSIPTRKYSSRTSTGAIGENPNGSLF